MARKALKELKGKLHFGLITPPDNNVVIRMGNWAVPVNPGGGAPLYRVPGSAIVNIQGRFRTLSRKDRAAAILHELGHMIYKDGKPLLKDDEGSQEKSEENSKLIAEKCKEQLKKIK